MGSTAYNYAAGGPVVSPGVEGILVTPAAPMSGISRTIMLAPTESLRLSLTGGQPGDGARRRARPAGSKEGDEIEVVLRAPRPASWCASGSKAAARSRVKLSLLDLPFLPGELLELLPTELRDKLGEDEPGGALPA